MNTRFSRRQLEIELAAAADPERAANLAWFFKTGKGQYGEGDRFLGIPVPVQRRIALRYRDLPLSAIDGLLASRYHEHRFAALEILVAQYETATEELRRTKDSRPAAKSAEVPAFARRRGIAACADFRKERAEIVQFYLNHTARINNWDLVDTSAPYILGDFLKTDSRELLDRLAASPLLWERRIAIVSTLGLIKAGEIQDTFRIAQKLLTDKHDLIQKAVGWALREAGRISRPALLAFLREHYPSVARTTLRYAIEHLPPKQRKQILAGQVALPESAQ